MAEKGGRAAYGMVTVAQCGASACLSALGIDALVMHGSVQDDVFGVGVKDALLVFCGVLISEAASKYSSFLHCGSDVHGCRLRGKLAPRRL